MFVFMQLKYRLGFWGYMGFTMMGYGMPPMMGYGGGFGFPNGMIPPYPGSPAFQYGQNYNPMLGNLTVSPYLNGLLDIVNMTQNAVFSSAGVGYLPPSGSIPAFIPWTGTSSGLLRPLPRN